MDEVVPGGTGPVILTISFIIECFIILFHFFPILTTFQTSSCDFNFRSQLFQNCFLLLQVLSNNLSMPKVEKAKSIL